MSHGTLKRTDSVEKRGLSVVKPRQTISTLTRLSEGQLESVLNLPVADVAGGVGHTKPAVGGRTGFHRRSHWCLTMENTVGDYPVVSSKVVVCIPEHGMVHQIEELHAELNSSLLSEESIAMERQAPVFE